MPWEDPCKYGEKRRARLGSGQKRRAGPAGSHAPGRPACRGDGLTPPQVGGESERDPTSRQQGSLELGTGTAWPASPCFGSLPKPRESVQHLESGDRDALGNRGESCKRGNANPLWNMERSGKEPFRERTEASYPIAPMGNRERNTAKSCFCTWDLRWPMHASSGNGESYSCLCCPSPRLELH